MISAEGLRRISGWLDSLLGLTGRIGILLVAGFVIYAAVQLLIAPGEPAETRAGKILALLNDNWRAALLVVAPLLYLPLRAFLNSVTEIRFGGTGFRRGKGYPPDESNDQDGHSGG